jgi:hypothetical protein
MTMAASAFLERYDELSKTVEDTTKMPSPTGPYNVVLRQLYSKLELLLLDVEEASICDSSKDISKEFYSSFEMKIDALKARLDLVPIKRKAQWWRWIDITFRFVGKQHIKI